MIDVRAWLNEQALAMFEDMDATGWIDESRAALDG
jgi:hypothetical protein